MNQDLISFTATSPVRRGLSGWLRRIGVLAMHTFTQLVRMKVFYFMLVFCVVLFVAGFVLSSISPDQELKLVKDAAFGVMQVFSAIFGIVGMAQLLPKDLEDRTLYTILSKPVRRHEYLLGKYLGVLLVLLLSLVVMDLLACGVLQLKYHLAESAAVAQVESVRDSGKMSPQEFEEARAAAVGELARHGLRWEMQAAVAAIFLKAAVITAVTLAVSTFAGSTIFTILVALSMYVIGHLQATARETLMNPEPPHSHRGPGAAAAPQAVPPNPVLRVAAGAIAVVFPDFQAYNVVDAVVAGKSLDQGSVLKMLGLTAVYLAIYLGIAVFIFAEKEL